MSARHSYLLASVATAGLVLSPNAAVGGRAPASLAAADVVAGLSVSSSGPGEFAGDRPLLATISPNGDGFRDAAVMQITLRRAARVRLSVTPTGRRPRQPVFTRDYRLAPGSHRLVWAPPASIPARTYLMLLDVAAGGHTWHFGARDLAAARTGVRATAVVRVQGVDAYFAQQSYAPGTPGTLVVATDAEQVAVTMHRIGPERIGLDSPNTLSGPQVGTTVNLAWSRFRSKPHRVRVWVGSWPSGLYYAELQTSDGRIGYAPFVVRPATLGDKTRVAIVLPTNTWQAYNFYDADGDGYGDTWYAGWRDHSVILDRPYLNRGVPSKLRQSDLPFLRWAYLNVGQVDYLSDDYLESLTGDQLAAAYDLLVFEGHEEYVDAHEYDAIEQFRDLGGSLMFLSANNFFWHIRRVGDTITRDVPWRTLGRPEAALIGVQYEGNDEGQRQLPYTVDADGFAAAPWLWTGTGLTPNAQFGHYGIEVDGVARSSPPGTIVLARIPNIYGRGFDAEMSYYETPRGSRVFAAGVLSFNGQSLQPTESLLLKNLWAHMTEPKTPPVAHP